MLARSEDLGEMIKARQSRVQGFLDSGEFRGLGFRVQGFRTQESLGV